VNNQRKEPPCPRASTVKSASQDPTTTAHATDTKTPPPNGPSSTPPPTNKRGDIVYTPEWAARDILEHFQPTGRILDPCRGLGAFHNLMPQDSPWCEISDGRDFFNWTEPVTWVIGNPPYSMTRNWFRHSYTIADNLLYLIPLRNLFSGYGFVREVYEFGGLAGIRLYGTGGRLGFPMGNAVGAVHIKRDHAGPCDVTFFDEIARASRAQLDLFDGGVA